MARTNGCEMRPSRSRRVRGPLLAMMACASVQNLFAVAPSPKKRAAKVEKPVVAEPAVAAMAGSEPVYVAEVDDLLTGLSKGTDGDAKADLRAAALAQAVNRRLVAQFLVGEGYAVDDDETGELVKELTRKLEARQLSFDEFLQRHGFNEQIVRRRLQWDVMWAHFLTQQASDEALEKFFERHRREYDGRELRVSHVLWPVKPTEASRLDAARQEAEQVRSQIVAGKLSFAKAAEKYSAGPSRRQGGDLGFIPRHDRMTESFSRAAFELGKGQISPPVVDQFGVHLIQCTDITPGDRTWQDVRRELVEAFSRETFLELAAKQRKQIEVKVVENP
jgi:hypothetical protein